MTEPSVAAAAAIEAVEREFHDATLAADIQTLERLLAPGMVYVNHLGMLLGREENIAAHRSGLLKVRDIDVADRQILARDTMAVVTELVSVSSDYDGGSSSGVHRTMRVWERADNGQWQLLAAQSTAVAAML